MKLDKPQNEKKARGDRRLSDRRKHDVGRAEGERRGEERRAGERRRGAMLGRDHLRDPGGDVGVGR